MSAKILTISDIVSQPLYNSSIKERFEGLDFIVSCGDLPYYYLEYIVSMLNIPLFFVHGNHDVDVEYGLHGKKIAPAGGVNLNRVVINHKGYLLAGVEGCIRYRKGPFMYTQSEMWLNVFGLIPGLLYNRLVYGRYVDIFVGHAAPAGIHDKQDFAHQGVKAFRWLIKVFKPQVFLHGHIHIYNPKEPTLTFVDSTRVINTYGYREITIP